MKFLHFIFWNTPERILLSMLLFFGCLIIIPAFILTDYSTTFYDFVYFGPGMYILFSFPLLFMLLFYIYRYIKSRKVLNTEHFHQGVSVFQDEQKLKRDIRNNIIIGIGSIPITSFIVFCFAIVSSIQSSVHSTEGPLVDYSNILFGSLILGSFISSFFFHQAWITYKQKQKISNANKS